jgi:hypothetical protein
MGRRKSDPETITPAKESKQRRNERHHEAHKESRHLQGRLYYWKNKLRKEHPEWVDEAIHTAAMERAAKPRDYKARHHVETPPSSPEVSADAASGVGSKVTAAVTMPIETTETTTSTASPPTSDGEAQLITHIIRGAKVLRDGTMVIRIRRDPRKV